MPFILIKNNLKLMMRGKWILFLMIILPVITIALLSNAFHDMMNTNYEIGTFHAGYRISDNSAYKEMLPELERVCAENKIVLQEYPDTESAELLQKNTVDVFVEIEKDSYTIYQSEAKASEAAVIESILSGFFYQANEIKTLMSYQADNGLVPNVISNSTANVTSDATSNASVVHETLDTDPVPSSTDYYGIIYIVYFAWCGIISLTAVITSERKNAVLNRMQVSHMTKFNYYIGKFVPCIIATFIETCVAWILSVLLLDIHWGNLFVSAGIIFLISVAASAFGMVLFQLFKNIAVSIVAGFIIIWMLGLYGGSFNSYMYSTWPQILEDLSPIYYINRTLVEYSTMGHSAYTGKCIIYLLGIIVVCTIAGVLMMNRKMEAQG